MHIKQARSQQLYATVKIEAAKFSADERNKVDLDLKVQIIIMDYCQNMNLPHLVEDQPRDA